MKVLNKLVWRNFFLNKKRTIVTIIGIMLSTALITAVANMAESFRASMVEYEKIYSGDFHYAFYDVKRENLKYFENNRNIQSIGCIYDVGYAVLEGGTNEDKPYLNIKAMDKDGIRAAGLRLISGRLPQNDNEVIISKHIRTNGGVIYKIGDKLQLSVGERISTGEVIDEGERLDQSCPYLYEGEEFIAKQNIEYTIVGIVERPNMHVEQRTAPGYTIVTFLTNRNIKETVNVYAAYTKSAIKTRDKVTASIFGISENAYRRYARGQFDEETIQKMASVASYHMCNEWLLKWELMQFSDSTKTMLYSVAAVLIIIIIVTSVFCIRNSFVISLTEKMKLYGMMSSIGATKKQRKRLVRGEAFLLGVIGIPLGIICGVLATYIVVMCTGGLMEKAADIRLIYKFSIPAIAAGAVLAAVTIYFSSGSAARKAAKISPIAAIRGSETVKIRANELRTPAVLRKIFKVEGTIAYKSLRRARVKYRTTVISIVVSVSVFVAMTTFTQLGFKASSVYYEDVPYQLRLAVYSKEDYKDVMWITQLEDAERVSFVRCTDVETETSKIPYDEKYTALLQEDYREKSITAVFRILSIGEAEYRDYLEKLGLSYNQAKDKGIMIADYLNIGSGGRRTTGMKYDYKTGDIINAKYIKDNAEGGYDSINIELAVQTDIRPMGLENRNKSIENEGIIVVSDEWMDAHEEIMYEYSDFFIQSDNPDELYDTIEERINITRYYLENGKEEYERQQSVIILVSVFLYGFIIVISLIGITNIFNTITTNMELRQREFAMLKSIGMTKKEFRRMIWLESIFYGVKSLFIGIPLGIALSICFYMAFSSGLEIPYQFPYSGILISVIAVFILLFVTTQYSMKKISKKNIVETIQNENI